ncbi:MAG: threonylcarbamoyl-AMP synthase [Chlorobi bacterium]|nr:threonylcarbamoyl-AMP synthase [Chlorobiota bacterium]
MAIIYRVYHEYPQQYKIAKIVEEIRNGAVVLYPTDTVHAIGCDLRNRQGINRIRQIKRMDSRKQLSFLCDSMSNIAEYAHVSDRAYRIIRRLIPGPYTFLLPASKSVPRIIQDSKKKTTGIRVPDNAICNAILEELGSPLVSTSARLPDGKEPEMIDELFEQMEKLVDVIVDDDQHLRKTFSTIIDMTGPEFTIVREGLGLEKALQYVH